MTILTGKEFLNGGKAKVVAPVNATQPNIAPKEERKKSYLEKYKAVSDNIGEFGEGMVKSALEAPIFTAKVLQKGGQKVLGAIDPFNTAEEIEDKTGFDSLKGDKIKQIEEMLKADGNVQKAGKIAEAIAEIIWPVGKADEVAKLASKGKDILGKVADEGGELLEKGKGIVTDLAEKAKTTLFGKEAEVKDIDDVIRQADESLKPSEILEQTEKATAKPSILQRWAGISPDIKNRIAGKHDKLKEYFDVTHARNNFDTLPTALEHGTKSVDNAVTKMEEVLNDTGSTIGSFRKKVSTYKATPDKVKSIEQTFSDGLGRLNLELKNGVIKQKPGTVTRINSDSEIGILNDLYKNLLTIKQSPNLERLIDLRTLFDSKINFAKSSREASNSLDPLSRTVRAEIARVAAEIVGKSEAANLTKYSQFIDAYNQLRSFTDRKAGAEFLLKQVLSEKGGTSREIIQSIKEITGIDLMDDAVMSSLATDLIGNSRQKGLFRQELAKAGLDVEAALTGNPQGLLNLIKDWGKKALVNEEKEFLKAAQ
jgi:hypothetical protein